MSQQICIREESVEEAYGTHTVQVERPCPPALPHTGAEAGLLVGGAVLFGALGVALRRVTAP